MIHQHRAALSGGDESRGDEEGSAGSGLGLVVPNSLSVRLEPDGEGGCQVSVRYGNLRDPRCSCLVYGSLKDDVYWALNVLLCRVCSSKAVVGADISMISVHDRCALNDPPPR